MSGSSSMVWTCSVGVVGWITAVGLKTWGPSIGPRNSSNFWMTSSRWKPGSFEGTIMARLPTLTEVRCHGSWNGGVFQCPQGKLLRFLHVVDVVRSGSLAEFSRTVPYTVWRPLRTSSIFPAPSPVSTLFTLFPMSLLIHIFIWWIWSSRVESVALVCFFLYDYFSFFPSPFVQFIIKVIVTNIL